MRSRRTFATIGACLALYIPVLRAQSDASLGAGAGTVRFSGGSQFSTVSLAPALEWSTPAFYLSAGGLISSLPAGHWAAQARGDFWMPLGGAGRAVRPAIAGVVAGTRIDDGSRSWAAHLLGELVWSRPGAVWGAAVGAGPSLGGSRDTLPVSAARFRARAWMQRGPVQYAALIEPTSFPGGWFTDVTAGAIYDGGRVSAEVWGVGRFSAAFGSKGTASVTGRYWVSPAVTLEASAGGYLAEPFQGFPRGGFVTAAVRLHRLHHALAGAQPVLDPLVAERRGDSVVVRFQMPGAASVAIAGDWNSWQPLPLASVGDNIWIGSVALAPGTYHFCLLVDGTEWVVPAGVATLPDGMGGLVAILTAP